MKVKSFALMDDIELSDLHSHELDGAIYYQKVIPSDIRTKLIKKANERCSSELETIVHIIKEHFEPNKMAVKETFDLMCKIKKEINPNLIYPTSPNSAQEFDHTVFQVLLVLEKLGRLKRAYWDI